MKRCNDSLRNRGRRYQRPVLVTIMVVCAVTALAQTADDESLPILVARVQQQDTRIQELERWLSATTMPPNGAVPATRGLTTVGDAETESQLTAGLAPTTSAPPALETASPEVLKARIEQQSARIRELEQRLTKTRKDSSQLVLLAQATPPAAAAQQQAPPAQQPAPPAASGGPTFYPLTAVAGIYTDSSTKDLGKLTGIKLFEGVRFRGWVDVYYDYNFNNPEAAVVNALQPVTAIKAPNATIQGRTFDVHSNSISLNLAEIEIEKVPERGGVGFKFDLAFGDTQHIYNDTIVAGLGSTSLAPFERTFQHASISYLAPIGKGLRLDFGKFVTHIGGETIEGIKNMNFSHSFFYTYAIPFQDTGLRMHYDFSDKVYNEFYLLNGWNVGFDLNRGKTYGYTVGLAPSPHFSLFANWLGGPEQANNSSNWRHLGDFQINISPTPRFRTMTNIDIGHETAALVNGKDARWYGIAEMFRYRASERFDPSFRIEWYRDPDGFTTGVTQNIWGFTATFDTFLGKGENDKILVRPEFRYDRSNSNFFSVGGTPGLTRKYQPTVGLNLIYYF